MMKIPPAIKEIITTGIKILVFVSFTFMAVTIGQFNQASLEKQIKEYCLNDTQYQIGLFGTQVTFIKQGVNTTAINTMFNHSNSSIVPVFSNRGIDINGNLSGVP